MAKMRESNGGCVRLKRYDIKRHDSNFLTCYTALCPASISTNCPVL